MSAYAKGHKPHDLEAACGGGKLERTRSFIKSNPEVGELGPYAKQDYSNKGAPAKRTGDKAMAAIKPRS